MGSNRRATKAKKSPEGEDRVESKPNHSTKRLIVSIVRLEVNATSLRDLQLEWSIWAVS
jgi:hypothetical protein